MSRLRIKTIGDLHSFPTHWKAPQGGHSTVSGRIWYGIARTQLAEHGIVNCLKIAALRSKEIQMICNLCGAFLTRTGGPTVCSNSCCVANFSDERCPTCHQMVNAIEKISDTVKVLKCKRHHVWFMGPLWVRNTSLPALSSTSAAQASQQPLVRTFGSTTVRNRTAMNCCNEVRLCNGS